jgi:transposase
MTGTPAHRRNEKAGRKPAFTRDELIEQVTRYTAEGLNQAQIAQVMNVHPNTFTKWKKQYPEIEGALKEGKELLIGRVENALVRRALGFRSNTEKTIVSYYGKEDGQGKTKRVERHISIERDVAPDLAAIKTLMAYLGKKLEKTAREETEDRIAYFLEGLREKAGDETETADEYEMDIMEPSPADGETPAAETNEPAGVKIPVKPVEIEKDSPKNRRKTIPNIPNRPPLYTKKVSASPV